VGDVDQYGVKQTLLYVQSTERYREDGRGNYIPGAIFDIDGL